MSATANNTMPSSTSSMSVGTISLTIEQLMEIQAKHEAKGRAIGRTEVLKELGADSTSTPSAVQPAVAPAPIPCKPSKGKSKRKRIILPDGTEVKNPTSAYIFYCKKHRAETKEANPELKSTQLTTALGAKWSALTDEGKVPYNALAAADKERYAAQVAQAAEAASGASTGATVAPAREPGVAPAAAPPADPPVLAGGGAATSPDIQPVSLPSSLMAKPAATAVFKTGASNVSGST